MPFWFILPACTFANNVPIPSFIKGFNEVNVQVRNTNIMSSMNTKTIVEYEYKNIRKMGSIKQKQLLKHQWERSVLFLIASMGSHRRQLLNNFVVVMYVAVRSLKLHFHTLNLNCPFKFYSIYVIITLIFELISSNW